MTKAHILQEIKRTAEANGGKPLGTARFASETGIKFYDWFGVHWARWGDAVREAGYEPNQLQSAYDKAELLEQYAALTLELGRLPVKGDLRLKAKRDSGFPNDKTFYDRIGPKTELVKQLVDYCRGRDGFEKVITLCEPHITSPRSAEVKLESSADTDLGYVYLMKSGKYYTIGRSNSVGRREYEHGRKLPEKITAIHSIKTDDPPGIEAYWLRRFDAKRKNGDWFDLDSTDVSAFKRRKFM
jgi:hypothetical protein